MQSHGKDYARKDGIIGTKSFYNTRHGVRLSIVLSIPKEYSIKH